MNPALGARCFLLISFTSIMTNFDCDAYTGATPLAALKSGESVNILNMVIGRTPIVIFFLQIFSNANSVATVDATVTRINSSAFGPKL